jgi:hypothetical protein
VLFRPIKTGMGSSMLQDCDPVVVGGEPKVFARVFVVGTGFWIFSVVIVAFGIWVAVDASKYPDWAFQRAGTQKWLFQILTPIAAFLCGIVAIVLGIIWFASKKSQVDQATRGGGPPEGTYGTSQPPPASTWGPPPAPGSWSPPPPPPPSPGPATPPPPATPAPDDPTGAAT